MRTRDLGLLIPATLLLVAFAAGDASAQAGRLMGRVLDAENNEPIRGATIAAQNPDAVPDEIVSVSDNKGRFAMLGMRSGTWAIVAAAPGYIPFRATAPIRTLNSSPVEFRLAKLPARVSSLDGIDTRVVQKDLQAAQQLLDGSKIDEAIAAYTRVLERMPTLSAIRLQLGRAYRMKKDYENALAQYEKIPENDPRYLLSRVEVGLTQLEKGDLTSADRVLSTAATAEATIPEAYYGLGEVKLARTESAEATAWYKRAAEADPAWARPFIKLGQVAAEQGDIAGARTYFERAIALDPKSPEAAQARMLLEKMGR